MVLQGHNLTGYYPYKMDAKCRISIPSDWRKELRDDELHVMVSSNEGLSTLRVITSREFQKMQDDVNEHQTMSPLDKRSVLGNLFELCKKVSINEQGKLTIPRDQLVRPDVKTGETVALCGRGDYFEIINQENHTQLNTAREARLKKLDADFGFF